MESILETGKRYKDREGSIVVIETQTRNPLYPFEGMREQENFTRMYCRNGNYDPDYGEHPYDLIEEVKE